MKRYSVGELKILYKKYHMTVHDLMSGVPCDACPGDPCSADAFFGWLRDEEKKIENRKNFKNKIQRSNDGSHD